MLYFKSRRKTSRNERCLGGILIRQNAPNSDVKVLTKTKTKHFRIGVVYKFLSLLTSCCDQKMTEIVDDDEFDFENLEAEGE